MVRSSEDIVLVTGASGFLGTYVAEACSAVGYRVLGADIRAPRQATGWLDFSVGSCEATDWESFVEGRQLRIVFHLAGTASVIDSVHDPYVDFATSVPGTVRLLSYLAKNQLRTHFVFFSSAAVYGDPVHLPVTENTPSVPLSPYGIHKASSEFLLREYVRVYNLRVSVLRVFSAFGAGLRKQFFWDLGTRIYAALLTGQNEVMLHGTGKESRDFVNATDVARAALFVANRANGDEFEVFNVASGTETTIAEAASLLLQHMDVQIGLRFNGIVRPGDPLNWRADVTKLAATGFCCNTTFNNGVHQVAQWLKGQLEKASSLSASNR